MGSVDFEKWTNELREMPSDASQWAFASQFIEEVARIITEKETERNRRAKLVGAIGEIINNFSEELEFLKLQDGMSLLNTSTVQCNVEDVLEVIESLEVSLVAYREAREMLDDSRDHERLIRNFTNLERAAESSESHYNALRNLLDERPWANSPRDPATEDEHLNTLTESAPEEAELEEEVNTRNADGQVAAESQEEEPQVQGEILANNELQLGEQAGPESYGEEHSGSSPSQVLEPQESQPSNDELDFGDTSMDTANAIEVAVGPDNVGGDDNTASEASDVAPEDKSRNSAAAGTRKSKLSSAEDVLDSAPAPDERRYGIEKSGSAATRYLNTSSLHDLESLMWCLVAEDDLSGAYWVARHLAEHNYEDVVTPELLKAVQGSRWLAPASNRYVSDLSEFSHAHHRVDASAAQELLELASSLHSSLIAPHSNMWGLLKIPNACPSAGPIVSTLDEFARYGHALRPEYVEGMGESVRLQDDIIAASVAAESWLESAVARRYRTFPPATNVWLHLTGKGGTIRQMLAPVRSDDRTLVRSVKESIELDSDELISRIGCSLSDGPWVPITGRARNWLINGINEASDLAERWCDLVVYERDVQTGAQDRYLIEHVTSLRSEIQRQSSQFVGALCELTTDSHPTDIAAAAQCALRSMAQVFQSLDISIDVGIPVVAPVSRDLNTINRKASSHSLSVAISRRLLWTDSVDFNDDGNWEGRSLDEAIHSLARGFSQTLPLEEGIKRRLDIQDFRFFEAMMEGDLTVEQKEDLRHRREVAQQDSLVTLEGRVKEVNERIIQALRDGVIEIDDDDWILYELVMSDISAAVDADDDILNYPPISTQLQDIQEGIERLELQRQNSFQEEWDSLLTDLDDSGSPAVEAWREKFEAARDNRNIRVMEECVIRLNSHSLGEPLPDSDSNEVFDAANSKTLTEFVSFVDSISDIERYVAHSGGLATLQSRLGLT